MKDFIVVTPKDWGPYLWNFLHCVPKYVKDNNRCKYVALFKNLYHVIPCHVCKEHYAEFYLDNKVTTKKVSTLFLKRWVLKLHNSVNRKLGRKQWTLKESDKVHKKLNIAEFLKFVNYVIKKYKQDNTTVFQYLHLLTFFQIIASMFPNRNVRNMFSEVEEKHISNINDLDRWFMNYLKYSKVRSLG